MPQENGLLEMEGSVENIVYHNDSNQYTVLEVDCGEELITVVGTFPYVSVGERLHLYGTWTSHATFGQQFRAQAFERSRPADTAAMLKYLSSGAVKGIGGALAATFGCILPSCVIVSVLARIYYRYRGLPVLQEVLSSLRPAVVALIAAAGLSILGQVAFDGQAFSLPALCAPALVLFAAALIVLRRLRWNPILVMALCGAANLAYGLIAG